MLVVVVGRCSWSQALPHLATCYRVGEAPSGPVLLTWQLLLSSLGQANFPHTRTASPPPCCHLTSSLTWRVLTHEFC